jgi:hypothetical protein
LGKEADFYTRNPCTIYTKHVLLVKKILIENFQGILTGNKYRSLSIKPYIGKDSAHDKRIWMISFIAKSFD